MPWAIAAGALAALGLVTARRAGGGGGVVHPEPRPGITAERVLPPSLVPMASGAAEAYAAARQAPQLLDGVYCHCHCSRHAGHRSLLTCFESDHGARCDICMGEAVFVVRLAERGNSLDQIRHAIDERFGS